MGVRILVLVGRMRSSILSPDASAAVLAVCVGLAAMSLPRTVAAQGAGAEGTKAESTAGAPAPDTGGPLSSTDPNGASRPAGRAPYSGSPAGAQDARSREQGVIIRVDRAELLDDTALRHMPAHPAAASHPHYDVIVCIAGCGGERNKIVYQRAKPVIAKTRPEPRPELLDASFGKAAPRPSLAVTPALQTAAGTVECVAGCGSGRNAVVYRPRQVAAAAVSAPAAGAPSRSDAIPIDLAFQATPAAPAAATARTTPAAKAPVYRVGVVKRVNPAPAAHVHRFSRPVPVTMARAKLKSHATAVRSWMPYRKPMAWRTVNGWQVRTARSRAI